ncbi:hypothetical protein GCM10011487_27680 [Steroidobacter agaridevorans]|uniref:DUF883 domain-containing protein n=1 Tax=Steroidobacter agaridevorans TaxID=2695856 RepID=A0A829YD62_9GAMM|nr:DUF883 family protein [Steroidobacter agaridevorans]GFE80768.1 hypothetical protein GCM10011487_27680 [Steroidobacter agaridevorans]GFE87869.1 hypothetical protein GCM10011488_28230 [Steroidobacter agaridevorans]
MRNGAFDSPIRHLRKDLQCVARDAEELLRATADVTNERVQEARYRTQKTVQRAFDNLYDRRMQRRVRKYARYTDAYVRDHSWAIIGAVAGVALVVGLLARRE